MFFFSAAEAVHSAAKTIRFTSCFSLCLFPGQVYNEITMACSTVDLISSIDRGLRLVIAKVRVRCRVKAEFFQVLFRLFRFSILL